VWNGALSSKTQWQLSRRARGFGELLNSTRSGLKYEGLYDEVWATGLLTKRCLLKGTPQDILMRAWRGVGQVRDLVWDAECTKAVQMEVQYEALHKGQFRDSMGRIYGGKITLICGMACVCRTPMPGQPHSNPHARRLTHTPTPTPTACNAALTGPHTASVAVDGRKLIGSKNTPRQYVPHPSPSQAGGHVPRQCPMPNAHPRLRSPIGFHHISARNILIATGSRPRQLADYPADGKRVLTSDHVTKLDHFPKSLCIIGAGVIGMRGCIDDAMRAAMATATPNTNT
jgi:hypothetical protein